MTQSVPVREVLSQMHRAFLVGDAGATELWLVRHADAYDGLSLDGSGTGSNFDPGLSERGVRQAQALADRLSCVGITAVYSSGIRRAVETAGVVAGVIGCEHRVREGLREVGFSFGSSPSGGRPEERLQALLDALERFRATRSWSAFGDAEPMDAVRQRVNAELRAIAASHPGERVAVISHGGAIAAYLADVLGTPREIPFLPDDTSISVVLVRGGQRFLHRANDTAHLEPALALV